LVTQVQPKVLLSNGRGALRVYHSFLVNGFTVFFLPPFFPFEMSYSDLKDQSESSSWRKVKLIVDDVTGK